MTVTDVKRIAKIIAAIHVHYKDDTTHLVDCDIVTETFATDLEVHSDNFRAMVHRFADEMRGK